MYTNVWKEILMCQSVFPCYLVIFLVNLDPALGDNYNVNYSPTLELNSSDVQSSVMTRPESKSRPFLLLYKGFLVKFVGSQDFLSRLRFLGTRVGRGISLRQ